MSDIKTRETTKNIKAFDRAGNLAERMKDATIKTKDQLEQAGNSQYDSPSEYAIDRSFDAVQSTVNETGHQVHKQGDKAIEKINDARRSAKDSGQKQPSGKGAADRSPVNRTHQNTANNSARSTTSNSRRAANKSIKTMRKSGDAIKQTAKSTGRAAKITAKGTIKSTQKSVKTAEKTSKVAIKTGKATAKAAAKSAQAAQRAAKIAFQASKAAAKATVQAVKVAVKATIAAVKAIIAGTKALIAAIAAGGWVAVVVILVICMVGLIVGSIFGVFISNDNTGTNGKTMSTITAEINTEFLAEIDKLKTENAHDEIIISGTRTEWKNVLAVYAVKVAADPDNPMEVATIDDTKEALLREIFWEMNTLNCTIETREETQTNEDGEEETVKITILHITISLQTPLEMAQIYGFTGEQFSMLEELLDPQYDDMWRSLAVVH